VTHPFHPWFGREFELIDRRNNWGEERVCFQDEQGRMSSILASFTDAGEDDPFVAIAAGRAHFRYQDLVELASLIARLRGAGIEPGCKGKDAVNVKRIMPDQSGQAGRDSEAKKG
jgi:hypothetical protein